MPQQLIYTSAPRGIVAGRSGHCTVARSAAMREALMLQLERLCYYQHLSLSGGKDRPIFSSRIVDIRGTRFHVVSRVQDAGLDFTGRTNFIAHHLVFTPEETRQFSTPPVILRNWCGWMNSWTREPELLENENWDDLKALASQTNVPAQTWQQVTGDAVNGYGLLEARVGASFRADDLSDETILALFSESLELLEIRDARRDFRSVAWNYTFTTSMQEQDNPADFRWRCLHSDNPAAARLATPDCRGLAEVRATKLTGEEAAFARTGRLAPRFSTEPVNVQVAEGERARFTAKAEGVPAPTYQWYKCNKDGKDVEPLKGETSAELSLRDPPLGVSRYRVWASNSVGTAQSDLVILSVEKKIKVAPAPAKVSAGPKPPAKSAYVKSAEDIESQRQRLEAEEAQETFQKSGVRNKIIGTCLVVTLIMGTAMLICGKIFYNKMPPALTRQPAAQTNADGSVSMVVSATGRPAPSYQWYKDNQMMPDATNSSVLVAEADRMNSGAFVVVVTNMAGAVTSSVVPWLGNPPIITQQPIFQTNKMGTVTITVTAAGGNPLVCEWYKDNQTNPYAIGYSLTPYEAGSFYAIVANKAGRATTRIVQWEPSPLFGKKKTVESETLLFAPGLAHKTNANAAGTKTNSPLGLAQ